MKIIMLTETPATGKMTIGQELVKLTDMKLFHKNMTLESVTNWLDWSHPDFTSLVTDLRLFLLPKLTDLNLNETIMTFCYDFNNSKDKYYIEQVKMLTNKFYGVELFAHFEIRVQRNVTLNRKEHKASKLDSIQVTKSLLRIEESNSRFQAREGEEFCENYIRINNTYLSARDVSLKILSEFNISTVI